MKSNPHSWTSQCRSGCIHQCGKKCCPSLWSLPRMKNSDWCTSTRGAVSSSLNDRGPFKWRVNSLVLNTSAPSSMLPPSHAFKPSTQTRMAGVSSAGPFARLKDYFKELLVSQSATEFASVNLRQFRPNRMLLRCDDRRILAAVRTSGLSELWSQERPDRMACHPLRVHQPNSSSITGSILTYAPKSTRLG